MGIINRAKFFGNQLRDVDAVIGQKLPIAID